MYKTSSFPGTDTLWVLWLKKEGKVRRAVVVIRVFHTEHIKLW